MFVLFESVGADETASLAPNSSEEELELERIVNGKFGRFWKIRAQPPFRVVCTHYAFCGNVYQRHMLSGCSGQTMVEGSKSL